MNGSPPPSTAHPRFRAARRIGGLLLGACLLLGAAPIQAKDFRGQEGALVTGDDLKILHALASEIGPAKLTPGRFGETAITGRSGVTQYSVWPIDCFRKGKKAGPRCKTLQFRASWGPTADDYSLAPVNLWNSTRRRCRAYRDFQGWVVLEMESYLRTGVALRNLREDFDFWRVCLGDFAFQLTLPNPSSTPPAASKRKGEDLDL